VCTIPESVDFDGTGEEKLFNFGQIGGDRG
jgi:hypothetical protein